jgi:hypothetical protein
MAHLLITGKPMLDLDIKSTIDDHIDVWDEGGALQGLL